MSNLTSISVWIEALRQGDPDAAERIWNHFHQRLVRFAAQRLDRNVGRAADAEDVLQNVFLSLYQRMTEGKLEGVSSEESLWQLLYVITGNKIRNHVRDAKAKKRGSGKVRGDSIFITSGQPEVAVGFDHFSTAEPSPEDLLTLEETMAELLGRLPEEHRVIATLKMQDHSNFEIAEKLNCSLATIERRLKKIRELWQQPSEL